MRPESPAERKALELACLEEVKRQAYDDEILKRDKTIIHDIRLEGAYPDTRIVVDVQRFSRRATLDWKLWDEGNGDFGAPPAGGEPVQPKGAASEIMTILYEF